MSVCGFDLAHEVTEREDKCDDNLHTKRFSASTSALGIGVRENKLGSQPVRDKVHLRPDDVHHTFPIHEDPHTVCLHLFVKTSLDICMAGLNVNNKWTRMAGERNVREEGESRKHDPKWRINRARQRFVCTLVSFPFCLSACVHSLYPSESSSSQFHR